MHRIWILARRALSITVATWLLALALIAVVPSRAQSGPPAIAATLVAGNLSQPLHVTSARDGSNRLFVVERRGTIRIIRNGALLPTPFLNITDRVQSTAGEQGLLSVAFPPNYAQKGYFYVNYTSKTGNGDTVVARFYRSADPDVANPASEIPLLNVDQPFQNHNGGQLQFGPDGMLYIGMGDGGSDNDSLNNAQNPSSLLGKLLRIDVESGTQPYAAVDTFPRRGYLPSSSSSGVIGKRYLVPANNPFVGQAIFQPEIWALGLRNPWRFSFDRQSGELYIGDVGQSQFEEIDQQPNGVGGQNYGWRLYEAMRCNTDVPNTCTASGLTWPIFQYPHSTGRSVTGGYVYRGQQYPALIGYYIYADFVDGQIWALRREGSAWVNTQINTGQPKYKIASFGEDETGELYFTDFSGGAVYRIVVPTRNRAP